MQKLHVLDPVLLHLHDKVLGVQPHVTEEVLLRLHGVNTVAVIPEQTSGRRIIFVQSYQQFEWI